MCCLLFRVPLLQESIKEHFAAFGSVSDVSIKYDDVEESKILHALVKFANRLDAEKVGNVQYTKVGRLSPFLQIFNIAIFGLFVF